MNRGGLPWIDTLVFSSFWLAAGAAALVAASAGAMGIDVHPLAVGLAMTGTLVVYNVDRLRDLERDRLTAPARSDFVARHRGGLLALTAVAAGSSVLLAASAGLRVTIALVPVLAIGLLHRRLKRFAAIKSAYITLAWLCVVVGLPWVLDPGAIRMGWVAAIYGATIAANAIASNLRDFEAAVERFGEVVALRAARSLAGLGLILSAIAPTPVGLLFPIPLFTLIALVRFRSSERYGLLVVDGALLFGALTSSVSISVSI